LGDPDVEIFLGGKAEFSSCAESSEIDFKWFQGQNGNLVGLGGDDTTAGLDGDAFGPQASTEAPRTDNDVCRDQTTNQVLTFEDAPEVRLTPVDGVPPLAEGKYKFELQVTDFQLLDDGNENIGSRFSSASVSLSMIELQIPDLGISVYEAVTTISKAGQINAETKVALTGVASSVPETSDTVRIDGMWEVSGVST